MAASDRSADRVRNLGHRINTENGGQQAENPSLQQSKRFNIVIEGIPDLPVQEIYSNVIVLADKLKVTVFMRDIPNVSRISRCQTPAGARPNPGPVVVTFVHAHLRDAILRKKEDFNGIEKYRMVYVNPDEPLDVRRQKARFRRIAYLARLDGHRVSYRTDSIRIGEVEYKISELSPVPSKYIPRDDPLFDKTQDQMDTAPPSDQPNDTAQDTGTKEDDSMQDKDPNGPVPDAGPPHLTGRTALRGGRICFSKRIPYCEEWSKVSDPKMDAMLDAKFSQNPGLMDKLIRTAPYDLVEATLDKKWGGGEPWHSAKYDTGTFTGGKKCGLKLTR